MAATGSAPQPDGVFFFTAPSPSAIKAEIAASSTVAASTRSAVTTSAAFKATSSDGCVPR
jgi:hypothetical protein